MIMLSSQVCTKTICVQLLLYKDAIKRIQLNSIQEHKYIDFYKKNNLPLSLLKVHFYI